MTLASSRCCISSTNSAGVGTFEGASGNSSLLNASALLCFDIEWNSKVYANEASVRAQH